MTTYTREFKAFEIKQTPDSANADFKVDTDGSVTTRDFRFTVNADVAATGSLQTDAAAVSYGVTKVTAADATKGVILPAAVAGRVVIIKNAANAVLKVYPATDDAINALSANAALSCAAYTAPMFVALDSTTWVSLPLLPS